jgi:parallel beta-helix repeat protein
MSRSYNLMVMALLLAMAHPARLSAETITGGPISGSVVWKKADSPFVITSDVEIKPGATLTIEPGCVVKFKPNLADQKGVRPFDLEIAVYGTLEAQGADGDTVYFTSDAVTPTWSDWAGIVIPDARGKVVLSRVAIEFATVAVTVQQGQLDLSRSAIRLCSDKGVAFIRQGRGSLTRNYVSGIGNIAGTGRGFYLLQSPDVVIEDNLVIGAQTGMAIEGSNARIHNNLISLCLVYGITISNCIPDIRGNNITQNEYGILLNSTMNPRISGNNIFGNAVLEVKVSDYWTRKGEGPLIFDLSGNWWGPAPAEIVYDKIEDSDDNPRIPVRVKIEPVLKEAISTD